MTRWIVVGIVLQVVMVAVGHVVPALREWWGPGGMLISLGAGCLVARDVVGILGAAVVYAFAKKSPQAS